MNKKYILQTKISSDISYVSINGGTSSLGEIPDTEWKNIYITEDRNLLENIISEFSDDNKINMRIIEYFDIDKNKITNFEKIKNMDIDEFSKFLFDSGIDCVYCIFKSDGCCKNNETCLNSIKKYLNNVEKIKRITNFEKIKDIEISGIKPFESLDGESVLAIFLSNNYSNCKECKFKSNDTCIGCMPEIEEWLKRES